MVPDPTRKQILAETASSIWPRESLGNVATLRSGYAFPSSSYSNNGTYKIITIANVQDGRFDSSECNKVILPPKAIQAHHFLDINDILISMTGYVGRVCLVNEVDCLLNQRVGKIIPNSIFPRYLYIVLRSPEFLGAMNTSAKGAAQGNLSVADILDYRIPLPPLPEQRAIAAALSDVDDLVASLDRLIAKKRAIKQGVMHDLLTGRRRLPGFSGGWEVKRLGEVASLYQPETIAASKFTEAGYPVYGANGVIGFYHLANHSSWQVTVTCRGSTCGTVNRTVDECWITGNAMVINCDANPRLSKIFFYYLLLSKDFSDCITGTGQPQIVRSPLAATRVNIPPNLDEQIAIAAVLTDLDDEIDALQARRNKTHAIKQAMMAELLTGRTRLL